MFGEIRLPNGGHVLRLLELAGEQRLPATALPTDWVELGKDGRALMAEPHILGGRVKLAKTGLPTLPRKADSSRWRDPSPPTLHRARFA
jgi:hypothetical protein